MQLNNSRRENDLSEEHKIVRLPVRTFLKILLTFPQGTKPEVKGRMRSKRPDRGNSLEVYLG